jgi:hypothetical protein
MQQRKLSIGCENLKVELKKHVIILKNIKSKNYVIIERLKVYIYIIYSHECNMFQSPGYTLENKQITWKHAKLTNKDFFWILKYFNLKKHYIFVIYSS